MGGQAADALADRNREARRNDGTGRQVTDIILPEFFLLAAGVLVICLFVWTVSGMFPAEFRPPALHRPAGAAILYGAILIIGTLGVHLVLFAAHRIAWPAAVIASGLVLLASPFIHKAMPRSVQDDTVGVVGFALGGLALHGLLAFA